jgi:hypothetical protein
MTHPDKQERRRADFGLACFFALIFLIGSGMFLTFAFLPPDDFPAGLSRWLIRTGSLIIGGVCLILFLFFIAQLRLLWTGKRRMTFTFSLKTFWRSFF